MNLKKQQKQHMDHIVNLFDHVLKQMFPPIEQKRVDDIDGYLDLEFRKIVGQDQIKNQLRQFVKKVKMDVIRRGDIRGKNKTSSALYHMCFSGSPGCGKTKMAEIVANLLYQMNLVDNQRVVKVPNSLELIGKYTGHTPDKVDQKFKEAKGGVLFIDEAYSLVDKRASVGESSYQKEAIDTIMKHLDPPTCVVILAGYEEPMKQFFEMNDGLDRRVPYRFSFEPYTISQLIEILEILSKEKNEILADKSNLIQNQIPMMLNSFKKQSLIEKQQAGFINNWIDFSCLERDTRLNMYEVQNNPVLSHTLTQLDLQNGLTKFEQLNY